MAKLFMRTSTLGIRQAKCEWKAKWLVCTQIAHVVYAESPIDTNFSYGSGADGKAINSIAYYCADSTVSG